MNELERFATKEDLARELERFATKEDLARLELNMKEDLAKLELDMKEELKRFATKEDLAKLEIKLLNSVNSMTWKFIGAVGILLAIFVSLLKILSVL